MSSYFDNLRYVQSYEVRRKLFHVIGSLFLIFLIKSLPFSYLLFTVTAMAFTFVVLDYTNLFAKLFPYNVVKSVYSIAREHELHFGKLSGATWLLLSVMLCLLFNANNDIVMISLLMVAFADPFAAFCGMMSGNLEIHEGKTLEGMMAFFIISVIIITAYTTLFPSAYCMNVNYLYIIAAVASVTEVISSKIGLDDNFSVPLFSIATYNILCILF